MTETITTTEPAAIKRARKGSVILTDRTCEKRVTERVKLYDKKCRGLFVSLTVAGAATFSFKFTDPATGKQRTAWLGTHNPETFTVEDARSRAYAAKATDPAALVEQLRQTKAAKAKHGMTVAEVVEAGCRSWRRKPMARCAPGSRAGKTSPATCGGSSSRNSAR